MTVDEQRGKDETFDASSPTPCQIPPEKAVTERGSLPTTCLFRKVKKNGTMRLMGSVFVKVEQGRLIN